ncbi:MAG TPA: DoxX family membrane protein [Polyangia bacterium]|nr:DoxX family membrane protein [Polyangia bacterium]
MDEPRSKILLRWTLAAIMVAIGVSHFADVEPFVRMVPAWLPWPRLLVLVSGACEIAGGLGLLVAPLRRAAAWGLVLLYLAVFPANINMALHHVQPYARHIPDALLWARLPFQALFIAWAWWFTRPPWRTPARIDRQGAADAKKIRN